MSKWLTKSADITVTLLRWWCGFNFKANATPASSEVRKLLFFRSDCPSASEPDGHDQDGDLHHLLHYDHHGASYHHDDAHSDHSPFESIMDIEAAKALVQLCQRQIECPTLVHEFNLQGPIAILTMVNSELGALTQFQGSPKTIRELATALNHPPCEQISPPAPGTKGAWALPAH